MKTLILNINNILIYETGKPIFSKNRGLHSRHSTIVMEDKNKKQVIIIKTKRSTITKHEIATTCPFSQPNTDLKEKLIKQHKTIIGKKRLAKG